MIKVFEKVIRDQLSLSVSKSISDGDFPLNFLKFSTVTSGSGPNDKVIFLVFKNQASEPFLCLKTVRNYEAKQAILQNFHNLQKLNTLTDGSLHEKLFSRAVFLYDDGENVFSIETACLGVRTGPDKEKLAFIVESYIDFQVYLSKQSSAPLMTLGQIAKDEVSKSGLNDSDRQVIWEYFEQLPPIDISLPRIVQHGDLTLDNILMSKNGWCVIDYDDVGNTDIPGFDLFCLFRRFSQADFPELCREYFPEYFKKIGGNFRGENYHGLLFLYHVMEYVKKKSHNFEKISTEQIIFHFERLYPVTNFSNRIS